ncbi:MAG: hypothetical protein Q9209_001870 [Squamulea sp. 1 TL-2023]
MAPASVANSTMEYSSIPETPTGNKQSRFHCQMRPSAEKYNRNNRLVRQRSPPVPEADLDTSKLAVAFPGFSGIGEDVKPLSPNPFLAKSDPQRNYQPRVRDENDVSIVSEARPSLVMLNNKNTRFGQIHMPKVRQGPQPHMYKPLPGLVQNEAAATSTNVSKPLAINAHGSLKSIANGSTQQTLNLPQGSNLTDIFSGVVHQPPPVNSQPARPRASRFASSKPQEAAEPKAKEIPVPANERHLLRSIDILQNRVAELEKIQDRLETTNGDLEQKTFDLQVEKKELEGRQRRDSAAGSTDSGTGNVDGPSTTLEQLASKNKRLLSHNWALSGQKDILLRDLQIAQTSIEELELERDRYKERFTTAESDIARIYSEKATVGQERAQAIAQLAIANSEIEALAQDKDALLDENEKLRAQIALLTRASTAALNAAPDYNRHDISDAFEGGPDDMDSISMINQQPKAQEDKQFTGSMIDYQPKAQQYEQFTGQQNVAHDKTPSLESSHNITYVSYAGPSSSCVVRKDLEQERKARRHLQQAEASKDLVNNVVSQNVSDEHARLASNSSTGTTKIRRRNSLADRTSSIIIDDITLSRPPTTVGQDANLAAAATAATSLPPLELLPLEAIQNETQQSELRNTQTKPVQETTKPGKQLTVSDEELDITIYDEEPTERPSQPPAAALAAVLESVHAERALQQTQLAKYQANYNRHDTALNRRQRKQLHAKIVALTESIDRKADQIYNLHDLVADQERKGQSVTQAQVDSTLQSLGLELPWAGIASSSTTTSQRRGTSSSRSL